MKKLILLGILFVLLLNLAYAGYECSTQFDEKKEEIDLLEKESINGLGIGLIKSDSSAALGRYYVELMIDAGKFELTNNENKTSFEIKSGKETIKLLDVTGDIVQVEIKDDDEEIEEDSSENVKGFIVYILESEGEYPGNVSVSGFVGDQILYLDQDNLAKKVEVDDVEYVIEIFTVSDDDAAITVKKCEGDITEVEDIVEEDETTNQTEEISNEENHTSNITQPEPANVSEEVSEESRSKSAIYFYVGIILLIVIGLIVSGIVLWNKSRKEAPVQPNQGWENVQPQDNPENFSS
jgi:hypothetical protein